MGREQGQASRGAKVRISLLAASLVGALSACGGGGSTRADPPPQGPPPTTPPPPPTVVEPPNPAYSGHLLLTGADAAHEAGLTGEGIRIGVVDSGVNRNHPALRGGVVDNLVYINPNTNNLSVDDVVGHGTAVAQVIAGKPFGQWPGGIAPGAEIVSARIISDKPPDDDGSGQGNEINGPLGLAPIHQDLINRGVRIMNNSWGGLYWNNLGVTAQIAAEYRPFIVNHGGLVVFSTGNSGFDEPSDTAALPSKPGNGGTMPAADLERGWLAVAALDGDNPMLLAEYSNACGVAMYYCLSAPGTVVVTGTNDAPDKPEYWRWRGTSFSAPIVSGAAALVWEAFPWFSNDQVRQTLLGTATDLGAPGVDPVFGYGAVNIERAVNGPSKLDWGDFVARFDDLTFVWSNRLTGEGALIKDGSGTLVIEATTTNAGGLEVRGGVLRTEFMVADNVTVRSGGTFQAGIWSSFGSDVDNAGRLELLSGEGQNMSTQIHGDYRHRDGATLALPLGRALDVNGTVTIQGGTLEVTGVVRDYTVHDREYLIHAFELDGQFDSLTWAPSLFLEGTLGYGPSQPGAGPAVWLDITRLDVAAAAKAMAGMSPAAISAAERVEQAFDGIDMRQREAGRISDDFIRIAGDFQGIADEREAKSALDSLSGEAHALATTLTFDAIDMGRRALSSRIGVQAPFSAGVWKQSMGQGGETGFASGGHALEGWLVGNDRATPDGHVVGFAFGETRLQDWLGANRERSRDRQTQARFYAGRGNGDGYALAHMGFGRFDRDIQRSLYAGEDARRGVIGSYGGDYASASFEAGRRHRVGDASLALYAGAEHARVRSGEFREWGDSGFALHAEAADMRRTQAFAGLRAGFDLRGASLRAHAEWQQVLSANGFEVQASFTGVDSWSPLPVSGAAESGGLFGLGIDAWLGRAASLSFGLDQRFGPRGNDRMASLRYVLGF